MTETDLLLLSELRRVPAGRARELRRAARLTSAEVGESCGVTRGAVYHWETGRRAPRGEAALRYARLLRRLAAAERGEA